WIEQSGPFWNGYQYCGSGFSGAPNARVIQRVSASSIDDSSAFVYYHYMDFLGREPDQGGWNFWTGQITQCGSNQACIDTKRVQVSQAFYESIEFKNSGYYAYRHYKAAFGRLIRFGEFLPDLKTLTSGVIVGTPGWDQRLENNQTNYTLAFTNRTDFRNIYQNMSNTQFVDTLFQNAGISDFNERQRLINNLNSGQTRASVLRSVVENQSFHNNQYNPAFVLFEYFGYLRRNPNDAPDFNFDGYNFWLNVLNSSGPTRKVITITTSMRSSSQANTATDSANNKQLVGETREQRQLHTLKAGAASISHFPSVAYLFQAERC
ncbi:MAG TPA: DUF4214 domain-containing protein, partial [Blastocatellia bacterium]|nr:DUF4214 domain-containing protein [Blastocatellia bacterium]